MALVWFTKLGCLPYYSSVCPVEARFLVSSPSTGQAVQNLGALRLLPEPDCPVEDRTPPSFSLHGAALPGWRTHPSVFRPVCPPVAGVPGDLEWSAYVRAPNLLTVRTQISASAFFYSTAPQEHLQVFKSDLSVARLKLGNMSVESPSTNPRSADRRCCDRELHRPIGNLPSLKPGSRFMMAPGGVVSEVGIPDFVTCDGWMAELDHYVCCHTDGRGLPSHVDARKIYRHLSRSEYGTSRHDHVVWEQVRFAKNRLIQWMKGKKHWEEGGEKFAKIPHFGGPEALIAVIIIGGNDGKFPYYWGSEWNDMKLDHLLQEPGSSNYQVHPFWKGAKLESEDWRKRRFFVPNKGLKGENPGLLSSYTDTNDTLVSPLPFNHKIKKNFEFGLNYWTHLRPYSKRPHNDPVLGQSSHALIGGRSGSSANPRRVPAPSHQRNFGNRRRETTGGERATGLEVSTPSNRQAATGSASSVPASNRRRLITEDRQGNGGKRPTNQGDSSSKRRRSPGINVPHPSPVSPASPRQQGSRKKKSRQSTDRLLENDRPSAVPGAVELPRGELTHFASGSPAPFADMSFEPSAPRPGRNTLSPARETTERSAVGPAARPTASRLPRRTPEAANNPAAARTPPPRRSRSPPPAAVRTQPLRRSRSPPAFPEQAERSSQLGKKKDPVASTRSVSEPSTERTPIIINSDSEVEEVKPNPAALRQAHKASKEKIMREYLKHLNEYKYKTKEVVALARYLNGLPASFWEQKIDAAVVRQCEADGPKGCKYKWWTHLRMIQEMFQELGYLDKENKLRKGRVPMLNTDLIWDEDEL
ncbi:hypothetical protein V8F20_001818 [Naviculisporaceae sp. PSN 640]